MAVYYTHPEHGPVFTGGPHLKRGSIIGGLSMGSTSKLHRWQGGMGSPRTNPRITVLINGDPVGVNESGEPMFLQSDLAYACPDDLPSPCTAADVLRVHALPPLPYSAR